MYGLSGDIYINFMKITWILKTLSPNAENKMFNT